jgi:hypothetical protein
LSRRGGQPGHPAGYSRQSAPAIVSISHLTSGARASRASAVTKPTFRTSASATYAASYGVTLWRNSHIRSSRGACDDRRSGRSLRSNTAADARRAVISFPATWRRHTDTTSRSMSSGAVNVSSASRSRARRPSVPSSPSATANTLASTTITFCPNVSHRRVKRHLAAVTSCYALEDLLQSWLTCICDQSAPKVFLQRLVRACGTLP